MKNRVTQVSDWIPIRNVLVSVSDKTGLGDFLPALQSLYSGVRFYSTGGTYQLAKEILGSSADSTLIEVSEYTGQPETQGGLVKTLDFKIHLGILTEEHNVDHQKDLQRNGAVQFDMVVVNLYPFKEAIARPGADLEDARGNIDIGGPTMARASAKNFLRVASVCDPADYQQLLAELREGEGRLNLRTRFRLAKKTFAHTAAYDSAISQYLEESSIDLAEVQYLGGTSNVRS